MVNLKNQENYFNRELSWLKFNTRVLEEAKNTKNPVLERLKFIAIYGTNLDEFYMIRVAGLKKLYSVGITEAGADKTTPLELLESIRKYLQEERVIVEETFKDIHKEMQKEKLYIKYYNELNQSQKRRIQEHFYSHLYPVIIPIAVDATHPFPHLNNLSFGLIVKLRDTEHTHEIKYGLVRIPRMLPRFIELDKNIYIPIGTIVGEFIHEIFPGFEMLSFTPFRVTRNADMAIEEEEADDFMEIMEEGLKSRKKGEIVRLEIGKEADSDLVDFIGGHINVKKEDTYAYDIPLNLGALWQIVGNKNFAYLTFPPYSPKILPPLDNNANIFSAIESQDICLYHPYESFDPVVNFIQSAAKDPDVLSIRMTLYRVGKNSPIVKSLIEAAEDGKQVTALVELKARFDEENNLRWARELEAAGAHVIYGIPGLKVHAKIALVIKRVGDDLREYAHLATGNYNPGTSRIYTDISYFTSRKNITVDSTRFFHHLTGFSRRAKLHELVMAPMQIKPKIISLVDGETKKGKDGRIIAKINSLVDSDVIRALYKASQAGVKIDLIVRGICCLRPKVEGLSENIRVISIVGKYLEHARIFYFANAHPQTYFSSADWMPRNLERRVELMTPVYDDIINDKLYGILQLQLDDNSNAKELQSDGSYIKISEKGTTSSQKMMEDYISTVYNSLKGDESNKAKKLASRMFKES